MWSWWVLFVLLGGYRERGSQPAGQPVQQSCGGRPGVTVSDTRGSWQLQVDPRGGERGKYPPRKPLTFVPFFASHCHQMRPKVTLSTPKDSYRGGYLVFFLCGQLVTARVFSCYVVGNPTKSHPEGSLGEESSCGG